MTSYFGFSRVERTPRLLRPAEVAELLAVSTPTIKRLAERGELPSVRVGVQRRFREEDVAAYLERESQ